MTVPPRVPPSERRAALALDPALDSPTRARHFASAVLESWQLGDLRPRVELLVSELVRNAVEHAGSGCTLTLVSVPGCLRIEVADDSALLPRRREPAPMDLTGRGLVVVEAIADNWGAEVLEGGVGKVVFCELDVPGAVARFQHLSDSAG
jgi:anti-sigma regulatory factor (Ser/Thr protein kinase)